MELPKILQHHINKKVSFFCFCFLHKKILKHKKSDFDFDKSFNTSMVWNIDFLFFFFIL